MKLPMGITGFYNTNETKPPSLSLKEVKRSCYLAIHATGATLLSFAKASYPKNYFTACVQMGQQQIYILINEHYPFVAFTSSVGDSAISFVDCPLLTTPLSAYFTILSQKVLMSPVQINEGVLTTRFKLDVELSEVEYDQLLFSCPKKLGEIIFNEWD